MPDDLPITDTLTLPGWCLTVTTSRGGGPGGQHVNTTDSRVRLHVHLDGWVDLPGAAKGRLKRQQQHWLSDDGSLVLTCASERSQHRNLELARERLAEAVRQALVQPKPRRKTRPTMGSKRRRLKAKKARGEVKSLRGKVDRPPE